MDLFKKGEIYVKMNNNNQWIKWLVVITFVAMVTMNALANILPINGQTTGAVSDKYANLFAPAGYTFSIWGFIYLLLAGYVIYQLGFFRKKLSNQKLLTKVGIYFSLSSVANTFWILCWHYDKLGLSIVLMLVILLCLIQINRLTNRAQLSMREMFLVRLPFSVYFGWITIATIANVTSYLVSLNWNGFGISEQIWVILILLVGALIGSWTMLRFKDLAYGFVLVWAYIGILVQHISVAGFNMQYSSVVFMVGVCLFFLLIGLFYISIRVLSRRQTS